MSDMLQFGNNLTQGQVGYGSKIKLPIRVRPQNTIRFKVFTLYLGRLSNPHGASFPAPGTHTATFVTFSRTPMLLVAQLI